MLALTQHLHLPGEIFCQQAVPLAHQQGFGGGKEPFGLPPDPILHPKVFCRCDPQGNPGTRGRSVFSEHGILKILLVQCLLVDLSEFTR